MTIADVVRLAVSDVTGISLSQLTLDTDISRAAIGETAVCRITDVLRERLHLGWLDAPWLNRYQLGELIDWARKTVPVYFEDGDRPGSVKLDSRIFRWHPSRYAPTDDPESFRAAFEDGPWKWDTQCRFAGKGINPGHFFGLTEEAASAEAKYYANTKEVPDDLVLLTLDISLDNILDLTQKDTIVDIVRECVDLDVEISHGQVAALLFAVGKGGTLRR